MHPERTRRAMVALAVGALVAAALPAAASLIDSAEPRPAVDADVATPPAEWVGAWAMAPMGAGDDTDNVQGKGFDNQTVRNIVHLAAGGEAVRFELSNLYGVTDLKVGTATVALRTEGGAIVSDTLRQATFEGHSEVTVAPGDSVLSDPIKFAAKPGDDLAISIYLPVPTGRTTWHRNTYATSYISSQGDHTRDADVAAFEGTQSKFYVTAVDVRGFSSQGTVVAFGDSITAGARSTTDANHSYPDYLASRMLGEPPGQRLTVINEGIGGNRLLTDGWFADRNHESALARFDRDVLSRTAARAAVMLFGTNDLFNEYADGKPPTADDLIRGTETILTRAHAHGIRVMVGTIPPMGGYSAHTEQVELSRQDFNAWIRRSGVPDAVVDFDAALRDPDDPIRLAEELDSGDHLHPNDAGYEAMANAVDLRKLEELGGPPDEADDYVVINEINAPQPIFQGSADPSVSVRVTNYQSKPVTITVTAEAPPGWAIEPATVTVAPGERVAARLSVDPPPALAAAKAEASATASEDTLIYGRPLLDLITAPAPNASVLALDGGTATSPVLTGYQGLTTTDGYTDARGYGWVGDTAALMSRDRLRPDDLSRDFVFTRATGTLRIKVPAGPHRFYLLTGDTGFTSDQIVISEGSTQLADSGSPTDVGEFRWVPFTLDGNADGRLADLTFAAANNGNWRLNTLVATVPR